MPQTRSVYIITACLALTVVSFAQPVGQTSPTSLDFGSVLVGTASSQKVVMLKNAGDAEMTPPSVLVSGAFAIAVNKCQKGLKAGANCKVWIIYTPQTAGNDAGTLTFADNASNSPQTVSLSGNGISFKTIYRFPSNGKKGAYPYAGLVSDAKGNLYGTTITDSASKNCEGGYGGCGTVFRLTPDGKNTMLHIFAGGNDGAYPGAGLVFDAHGNLYGTTGNGGASTNCDRGCGTLFKVTPNGTETVLYSFGGYPNDGIYPNGELVLDSQGNLYGTTLEGGNSLNCELGCGTVFKLTPSGAETVLYSFVGFPSDGTQPSAALIFDMQGNLYGTTYGGGSSSNCNDGFAYPGCGTVFKLTPGGSESLLYSFAGGTDGAYPLSGLAFDAQGNLYGTTQHGGWGCTDGRGCGTVFKLTPSGMESVLYSFTGGTDGAYPNAGLVLSAQGDLYGTTGYGGSSCDAGNGCGTVFKVTPSGTENVLYSLSGEPDGAYPYAGLVFGEQGSLYGTAAQGGGQNKNAFCGTNGCGVVFTVAP